MAHQQLYKIQKINNYAYGVYSRYVGSEGGWILLKTCRTEEECEEWLRNL